MVDLLQHYRANGLDLTTAELPDYLPLFLEFLSLQPVGEIQDLLGETAGIIPLLQARLAQRRTPYAAVLGAIETLAPGQLDRRGARVTRAGQGAQDKHGPLGKNRRAAPVACKGGPQGRPYRN